MCDWFIKKTPPHFYEICADTHLLTLSMCGYEFEFEPDLDLEKLT